MASSCGSVVNESCLDVMEGDAGRLGRGEDSGEAENWVDHDPAGGGVHVPSFSRATCAIKHPRTTA